MLEAESESCIHESTKGEEYMDLSSLEEKETLQERNKRLAEEIQTAFNVLSGLGKHNSICNEHFKRDRVIVDVALLLHGNF